MASTYTELFTFLADVLKYTYNNKENRPKKLNVFGTELEYKLEKSCCKYSHYETEDFILVGVRGVNNLYTLLVAFGQSLQPDIQSNYIKAFCKKYDELIKSKKRVFIVAHSLGAFSVASCAVNYSKKIKAFFYAPYVPVSYGKVFNEIQNSNYKKIFYINDFVSNKLLFNQKKLRNTLIFKPKNLFSNTHSVKNYQRPASSINNDLYKYIN